MRNRRGATAVEYGLIAGLIAVAMIAGFGTFTSALTNMFGYIQGKIETPVP
jgi:pilus assembly protein Flp/PilA